ncbi:uncharacterized protein [Manis javanica]|uniref:uncharacterized protein n=1 Tax=Manis javanica TaxID=9974 RepID=UPI003C6D3C05
MTGFEEEAEEYHMDKGPDEKVINHLQRHEETREEQRKGGLRTPGGAGGCGGDGPGAGAAGRARGRAPAGGERPHGAPCRRVSAPVCAPVRRRRRAPAAALQTRPGGTPEPTRGEGSRAGEERRSGEAGHSARAHAHAAAGLGRLSARAGGRTEGGPGGGGGGGGDEGARLPGAGRLPPAPEGDRTQLATSGIRREESARRRRRRREERGRPESPRRRRRSGDAGNSFLPREKLVLHDASRINFQVFSSGEEAEPVTRGITLSEQLSTAVIVGNIKEQKEGIDLMPTERPRIKGKNLQM